MAIPIPLPDEASKKLDMPEGTVNVGFDLPVPLDKAPDQRTTLITGESPAKTVATIDVDEDLHVHFVRQAPNSDPADVDVDVAPLRGASKLDFWCVWSPTGMAIHVVDRDQTDKMVSGYLGDPPK